MFLGSISPEVVRPLSGLLLTSLVLCAFIRIFYLEKVFFNIGFYIIAYPAIYKALNRLFYFLLIRSFAINVILGVSCLITTVTPSF